MLLTGIQHAVEGMLRVSHPATHSRQTCLLLAYRPSAPTEPAGGPQSEPLLELGKVIEAIGSADDCGLPGRMADSEMCGGTIRLLPLCCQSTLRDKVGNQ